MSLYNLLFGVDKNADAILALLGKTRDDFGRFRDASIENGKIVVYTRCGGGNRAEYRSVFKEMRKHPWYSDDEDDDYDTTYASIYFEPPQELRDTNELFKNAEEEEEQNVLDTVQKETAINASSGEVVKDEMIPNDVAAQNGEGANRGR